MKPFSAIIAWRNRPELAQTLRANVRMFERYCEEVIVVNCGGDPDALSRLAPRGSVAGLRQVDVPGAPFNKSFANNIGAACSSRPFLFFVDADIILRSDLFVPAQCLLEREACFVKVRKVHESQPAPHAAMRTVKEIVTTTTVTFNNGLRAYTRTYSGGDGSRCGAGLILMRRTHLMAIGGFNSAIKGWGFEDVDLHFRLQFALGLKLRSAGQVLHLTHGNELRDIRSGSMAEDSQRNMVMCAERYSRNEFTGSLKEDVRHWGEPLREMPLPTAAPNPLEVASSKRTGL
jgi:hypothetical protein